MRSRLALPLVVLSLRGLRAAALVASVCIVALIATSASAQTTYVWNQTGAASFATAANWSPARTVPAANDVLLFNNGATTTVTDVPTQTIGQLFINGNTNVTFQAVAAGQTLTIAGGGGDDLSLVAGSQLNISGANTLSISLGAGATGGSGGAMTFSGAAHKLLATAASPMTFQAGSTFTAGTGFTSNAFGTTSLNSIIFASGSTYVSGAGSNPFGAGQPSSVVVFQPGSLYRHQQAGAPSLSGRTYANFELNFATTITANFTNAWVVENLTLTLGTINYNMTGTPGHAIRGNISTAVGTTLNFNPASAGTVSLNGLGVQSITNNGTLTINNANQTIIINNANGIVLNSNVAFSAGTLQLSLGNISTGANTLTVGATANVTRPGTGHVIGNLRKDFSGNGSKVFEVGTANGYSPFTANVTAGTPGNITCAAVQGPQPNMTAATSLQRYWTLSASAGITSDLTFQYLDPPDVMGNEALYQLHRVNGGVPAVVPGGSVNTAANTATVAGINAFSDWTLGEVAATMPLLTVSDVSQVETNSGTTTFNFSVNLDAPAPSNVTFEVATADGTAQDDNPASEDNDYVAIPTTPVTITTGNSSAPVAVFVNGDIKPEANETFFVNVTNISGATPSDTQGQGTIQDDPDVPCAGLSITDVSQVETNSGTTTFAFTVALSQTGCGPVTFDIATQDNTATTADNDYVPQSLTGQTITFPGTYTFNVAVNGDVTQEADQTFFVNITNVTPLNVNLLDVQGLGTIQNDDFTRIHDIQGNGTMSPFCGAVNTGCGVVTTRGIVTGRKSNGYFIQEPDASVDADPMTSEGIFVFTSAAPPAAAAVGNLVEVTATVFEFVPSQDPLQPPLTELTTSPVTVQLSAGNPLPAAIPLTATFPDPAGPHDQLERLEGMRVSVASLTVGGPTLGNVTETSATATSTGVFYGTVTGVPRAFREPGIQAPDPAPSGGGSIPPIPRFDSNPEVIRVDDALVGAPVLDVSTGAVVTGLIGPLDYGFRKYTILPEPAPTPAPVVVGGMTATSAAVPTGSEFTVAAYNLERFYDDVNDAGGDVVLTTAAFNNRLNKASIGIRNFLSTPDILAVVEVENLNALGALATKINNDAVAASQPNPLYTAHLIEGNDVGLIDVGFLVKTAIVTGATPRVTVNAVVQENDAELFVNPDSSTETLHDRPFLRLDAVVNDPNGATYPVTVIAVHNRSLNNVTDETAGSNGWATGGARVRAKRQKQAESLATLVQTRQTNNPAENIIILGDYNAFEFNDGLGDSMNVITGTPPPDNQTAVPGDGVDLVNPDLDNLFDTSPASDRYSFVFDGNAQSLDHVVVNSALISSTVARRLEHPRINADFAAIDRNNSATALRLADHDPVVGFFEVAAFAAADVSLTKVDSPDPVNAGANLTYTITVTNAGPDPAATAAWSDTLPAGTTFVSLSTVAGWSCTTPAVGANGTVSCSNPSFAVGSAVFTLTVNVAPTVAAGTVLSNTATATSATADPNTGNESDTETTTVAASADLLLTKTDSPDPVNAGSNLSYQITLTNNGPSNAASASFSDTLPAGTTFVSLSTTGSWTCTTPAVGANGTVSCSNTSFGVTVDFFTIVVNVDPTVASGTILSNTATLSAATTDSNGANNSDTETTTVTTSANLSVTKTDSPDPVTAGTNLTYTITVNNAGPSNASTVALSDALPAGTTFVSLSAPGGWSCTTPAVGATGTISCSIATLAAGNAVFTLTLNVNPGVAPGTIITNTATATSTTSDPTTGNESGTATTTVGAGSADLSVTKTDSPDPVTAGTNLTYTITVNNAGPGSATTVSLSDTTPAGTTFVSLSSPGGWSCTTPGVGSTGTINCSIASLGVTSAVFTLVVNVNSATVAVSNTATVTSATVDPNTGNESDTETTAVATSSDLRLTKTDSPDPVTAGTNLTYTIGLSNFGPSDASGVTITDTIPANTTFVSLSSLADFSCTTPAVGGTGTITCTKPSPQVAGGSGNFTLVVNVNPSTPDGTIITNTATVTATTTDPNIGNESATATTTVGVGSADLSVTKSDSPDPVNAGGTLTYTITVNNAGPTNASTVSLSDALPANTTFVSLVSAGGWSCTTPAVGATGTVSCTNASLGLGNSVFTLTVAVDAATPANTLLSNTATVTSATTDPASGNNSATETTAVRSPATLSATKTASGTFQPLSTVTYTIVISNSGPSAQGNNPGDEMVDVLPAELILVSATATSGTAVANTGTNTVAWNGSIAAGGSVTVTITATIAGFVTPGTTITNQATISYDADGNGTNEATAQSDNPATGGSDATAFVVAPSSHIGNIPTLDARTLLALAALLATVAIMAMKKA